MLMKLANVCHILDLPNDVYPMDMAVNFLQTGNQTVKLEDQTFVGTTILRKQMMSLENLHPDIQNLCQGLIVVESELLSTDVQLNQDFQLSFAEERTYIAILWRILSGRREIMLKRLSCLMCRRAEAGGQPARK